MTALASASFPARLAAAHDSTAAAVEFLTTSTWAFRRGEADVADLVLGNPHQTALPAFVSALREHLEPRTTDWFAYKMNETTAQQTVAASLSERYARPFESADVFMTTGAFAGLSVTLKAILDPGDEVVFVSPPWFFYEALILGEGGVPVRVRTRPPEFDLDLDSIGDAITPRTRAIIVNSPNNPTGCVYASDVLAQLAEVLTAAADRNGRPIYLLADDAYSRIVYDGRVFQTPALSYPHAFLIYTYGKTLLAPGQRLGYIALPPTMEHAERDTLRSAITLSQLLTGYAFPNALLQHALPDLEHVSIDVAELQRKRDRLVAGLRLCGYQVEAPQGTFYVLSPTPTRDDRRFVEFLAARDVFVLPGTLVDLPGYVRLSLTATDAMIDRALTVFAAAA